jgi:hypothetical protein
MVTAQALVVQISLFFASPYRLVSIDAQSPIPRAPHATAASHHNAVCARDLTAVANENNKVKIVNAAIVESTTSPLSVAPPISCQIIIIHGYQSNILSHDLHVRN